MIKCSQCQRELGPENREASIAGSIMGDEYIETYYFCRPCGVYTVEVYHDRFLGEDEVSVRGPVPREGGQAQIELIRQCSQPGDKNCRCPAHRKYFGNRLD